MMRGESTREGRRESVMGAWKCMGVCVCLYVYAHIWTRSDGLVWNMIRGLSKAVSAFSFFPARPAQTSRGGSNTGSPHRSELEQDTGLDQGEMDTGAVFVSTHTLYQVYGDGNTDLDDPAASLMTRRRYDEAKPLYRRYLAIAREVSALVYVYASFTTLPIRLTAMNILNSPRGSTS
jgi:hypothetical protein